MRYFPTLTQIFTIVSVSMLLLTPVVNIPGPLAIRSLDVYPAAFFTFYVLFTAVNGRLPQKRIIFLIIGASAILFAQMLILEIIHGYGDLTGVSMILRSALWVLVSYGCAQFLIKTYREKSLVFFIKIVIACAIVQGVVLWLTFLSPEFRDFMSSIFYRDTRVEMEHLIMLRTPGFVSVGGDGLSFNQALLAIVGLIGARTFFRDSRAYYPMMLLLITSLTSTFLAGRSGLYLGIFFALIIVATRKDNFQISRRFFGILFAGVVLALPLILFSKQFGDYGQELLNEHGYEYPAVRLLRGFIDMQSTGQYSDQTLRTLLVEMVVIPEDPLRFLIGNNDFGQLPKTSIATDVGYFRMMHGFGFLGLAVFLICFYLLPVFQLHLYKKSAMRVVRNPRHKRVIISAFQMLLFVLAFGLIAHYKIFYFSTRIFIFIFFVLLFLVFNYFRSFRYSADPELVLE